MIQSFILNHKHFSPSNFILNQQYKQYYKTKLQFLFMGACDSKPDNAKEKQNEQQETKNAPVKLESQRNEAPSAVMAHQNYENNSSHYQLVDLLATKEIYLQLQQGFDLKSYIQQNQQNFLFIENNYQILVSHFLREMKKCLDSPYHKIQNQTDLKKLVSEKQNLFDYIIFNGEIPQKIAKTTSSEYIALYVESLWVIVVYYQIITYSQEFQSWWVSLKNKSMVSFDKKASNIDLAEISRNLEINWQMVNEEKNKDILQKYSKNLRSDDLMNILKERHDLQLIVGQLKISNPQIIPDITREIFSSFVSQAEMIIQNDQIKSFCDSFMKLYIDSFQIFHELMAKLSDRELFCLDLQVVVEAYQIVKLHKKYNQPIPQEFHWWVDINQQNPFNYTFDAFFQKCQSNSSLIQKQLIDNNLHLPLRISINNKMQEQQSDYYNNNPSTIQLINDIEVTKFITLVFNDSMQSYQEKKILIDANNKIWNNLNQIDDQIQNESSVDIDPPTERIWASIGLFKMKK